MIATVISVTIVIIPIHVLKWYIANQKILEACICESEN